MMSPSAVSRNILSSVIRANAVSRNVLVALLPRRVAPGRVVDRRAQTTYTTVSVRIKQYVRATYSAGARLLS